jgi:hypothetical protein
MLGLDMLFANEWAACTLPATKHLDRTTFISSGHS